jgi:predicted lipoprotein
MHLKIMMILKKLFPLIALFMVLSSCGGDDGDPSTENNTKDRQAILINWVDNIIIPSYANFKTKLDVMIEKTGAFTSAPDNTTLSELREAWVNAYIEWQKVELFEFGPADSHTLRNFFNIYPANIATINTNINDAVANLDLPSNYASQGFPALDYLINGLGADDPAIIEAYTSDADAEKRIAYLNRLTARMSSLISSVVTEWNGSYRETFINKTGLDIGSSFGNVVNAYVLEYERYIRSGKIGIPAGVFSSNVIQPERVEGFYKKDISLILAETAHETAYNFFNGKISILSPDGPGFKSYLDALEIRDTSTGTLLSSVINSQFVEIANKLNVLSPDFSQEVQSNNVAMLDTYTSMQRLVRLLKLDMTSAISVTITYTDNDGD